ncbi:MAG: DUF2490 domain-containing protein [Haliscomenobacter sp.]|nr:DUF2490 domain-containing protein [Haliscomenobacter sp.]MBK7474562.1 DUF2490 domain-containing protein [Haliscomenobacter sp.]MBK8877785.1 DUF2490 domain-containing protein [Haliscomenobacter sp.]
MKIRPLLFLLPLLLGMEPGLHAQTLKSIDHADQVWVGYLNQTQLSTHWGFWYDMHLRSQDHWSQGFLFGMGRVGATYYASPNFKVTAGYAFLNFFPDEGHLFISQPEHRIWQQVQILSRPWKLRVLQQIRLEQRFKQKILDDSHLSDQFAYTNRARYNVILTYPFSSKSKWSAVVSNEILINFGKNVVNNAFDQDRVFLGLGYKVAPNANLQAGYLYTIQQSSKGYQYKQSDVVRVFLFHNLDFRKSD